jgi:hypothetical protein
MLISRRADVRCSAVLWSSGTGLPSAVDAARDVDEVLDVWNRNEKGENVFRDACGGDLFVGGADDTDVPDGLRVMTCGRRCWLSVVDMLDFGAGSDDREGMGSEVCEVRGIWGKRDMETCSDPMAPPSAGFRALAWWMCVSLYKYMTTNPRQELTQCGTMQA